MSALATVEDEGLVEIDGTEVLTSPRPRYNNLAEATAALVSFVRDGETARVRAARVLQWIRDSQAYREVGAESFAGFLPMLLENLSQVGLNSPSTVKKALIFADLFLDELQLDETAATRSVAHLMALHRLADIDRKTGELRTETDKEDKLNGLDFEEVTRTVVALVTQTSKAQKQGGLTAEETAAWVRENNIGPGAELYQKIVGRPLSLPAGGWKTAHTREIVDCLVKKDDEEDEPAVRLERVWVGEVGLNELVHVRCIEFRRVESDVAVEVIEVNASYPQVTFDLMKGKDKAEIAGTEEGE